jgi:HK97 family phage prohead protease/HK97 family phage major capsid protein
METLYIEASSIECSEERREISGLIVPMGTGEVGHTNLGGAVFEAGSIDVTDISKIKLLSQHDMKKPVGRMTAAEVRPEGIYATFKLSRSTGGNDALIQAQEGLVSGLSIGAEIIASKPSRNGHMVVTAAKLKEVSLVTEPAFKSAQVLEIAAEETLPVEETPQTESETVVEDTTVEATPVEAAAVEAARPTITAMVYSKPRIDLSNEAFLENSIRAQFGDENARQYLAAASDVTTTDVAGLVPTRQLTEIINNKSTAGRPSIDAIQTGTLPDAGFKFQIPRVKTVPTVAEAAEGGAFSDTEVEIEYLDVDVKKYAGMQLFDVEVLDRTSPAFFAELQSLMADAYAKATNVAVRTAIQTGATADGTAITLPWDGAEMAGFIARASDSIYTATLRFASGVIVSPTQWSNIMGMVDSSNRPLFIASQPQNAAGNVSQSLRGSLLGLDLYVDYSLTGTADGSIVVVNRDSFTWYESNRLQLRADKVGTGKVEVGYYGYGAIATKVPSAGGAFKFNNAA